MNYKMIPNGGHLSCHYEKEHHQTILVPNEDLLMFKPTFPGI